MSLGEIQKKLFEALNADAPLINLLGGQSRIYDAVPKRRQFPFLVIGSVIADDWSTSDDNGHNVIVTIRIWSDAQGRKSIYAIEERVRAIIDAGFSTLIEDALHIVLVHPISARFDRDNAIGASRATLRYRLLLEPKQ